MGARKVLGVMLLLSYVLGLFVVLLSFIEIFLEIFDRSPGSFTIYLFLILGGYLVVRGIMAVARGAPGLRSGSLILLGGVISYIPLVVVWGFWGMLTAIWFLATAVAAIGSGARNV